jgi:gliding motility-associated-like protein
MKRSLQYILRLMLAWLPILLAAEQSVAQTVNTVYAGQTSQLSVTEIPGDNYTWEIYKEVSGVNFATTPGNCPASDGYFTGSNTGPDVTVMWVNPGIYFFKVTANSQQGCMNLKIGKVEVLQAIPSAIFANADSICEGDVAILTVLLTGTPPFSITYTDGSDTFTIDDIPDFTVDIIVNPTHTTNYWITYVSDATGNSSSDLVGPVTVQVYPLPEILALDIGHASDGLANGSVHIITAGDSTHYEYSITGIDWYDTGLFEGLWPGAYTAYVRDSMGCLAQEDFEIFNIVEGEVEIMAGVITGCSNTIVEVPVMASGFSDIAGFNIKLDFDETVLNYIGLADVHTTLNEGLINYTQSGQGSVSIEFIADSSASIPGPDQVLFKLEFIGSNAGLSALNWDKPECYFFAANGYILPTLYVVGQVAVSPSPKLSVSGDGFYCEGDDLMLLAQSLDNQNVEYLWHGPDGSTHNGASWYFHSLELNHSGMYTLIASNNFDCDTIVEVSVIVNPIPDVSLGHADTSCITDPIWLEPGIWYTSYKWHDGSTQSSFLATQEGSYWVEVTNESGCSNVANITLVPCDIELLIPNAFTPNGDGLNDEFGPLVPQTILENYTMLIYNKWGQLLFETNEISDYWNGTFNGKLVQQDVYTYIITYELPSYFRDRTLRQVNGSVMLIR